MTDGTGPYTGEAPGPLNFRQIFKQELQSFPRTAPDPEFIASDAWATLANQLDGIRILLQVAASPDPRRQWHDDGGNPLHELSQWEAAVRAHGQPLPEFSQKALALAKTVQQQLRRINPGNTNSQTPQVGLGRAILTSALAIGRLIAAEQNPNPRLPLTRDAWTVLLKLLTDTFNATTDAPPDCQKFLDLSGKLTAWCARYNPEDIADERQLRIALQESLIGLSFSGGGIRSATFNLGVLQGLADCTKLTFDRNQLRPSGLLGKIHYLSSVSGGGYIAAWLAGWIARDGKLKNVEQQLRPNRIDQATADRGQNTEQAVDPEPPPFHHLREFSNYLTPKTGIFSTDSWTLYSLYARNLIAIQSLLVPLLATVIFTVLAVAWLDVNFLKPDRTWYWFRGVLIPLAFSSAAVAYRLNTLRPQEISLAPGWLSRFAQILLPLPVLIHFISDHTFPPVVFWSCWLIYAVFALYTLLPILPNPPAIPRSQGWRRAISAAIQPAIPFKIDFDLGKQGFQDVRKKWFQVETQGSVFLVMFLFIIAAASLTGFLTSLIGYPAYEGYEDPLTFLDRRPHACYLISSITVLVNRAVEISLVSPLVASTLLNMAICALARLLFHTRSICQAMRHWCNGDSEHLEQDLRWILSGIASGVTSGGLLTTFEYSLISVDSNPIRLATFGPPLILLTFAVGEVMALAVLSVQEPPRVREWFAAIGGKILMAAGSWITIFGLILYAPLVFSKLHANSAALGSALLWFASSVLSAKTAYRSKTDGNRFSIMDVVIRLGPPLFLIGLFLSAATAAAALIQFVGTNDPYRPLMSFNQLLDQKIVDVIPRESVTAIWSVCALLAACGVLYLIRFQFTNTTSLNQRKHFAEIFKWVFSLLIAAAITFLVNMAGRSIPIPFLFALFSMLIAFLLGRFININLFSLQELYQNRLVRCYLGASRPTDKALDDTNKRPPAPFLLPGSPGMLPRSPELVTGFDEKDDFHLGTLDRGPYPPPPNNTPAQNHRTRYDGPFHLFCTALNLVHGKELAWQERMAESFVFTPLHAGSIGTGFRRIGHPEDQDQQRFAQYGSGVTLGQVVALSGAAVSPNMGYYSTAPVTALLTIFNLRLGAWLGNPRTRREWIRPGPRMGWLHLLKEVLGFTDSEDKYVYISDGGHFDNLGAYELIRRRCRIVICCDAGADPHGTMHELGMLIRKVRTDFGIRVEINTNPLKVDKDGFCRSHAAVGRIKYSDRHGIPAGKSQDDVDGYLIYIKPSFTGDEPSDIIDYRSSYPDFPHQTTIDQFFSESQFESYRALGYHAIQKVFLDSVQKVGNGGGNDPDMLAITQDVYRRLQLSMNQETVDRYVSLNDDYARLQKELGSSTRLKRLAGEIQWLGELLPLEIRNTRQILANPDLSLYTNLKNQKLLRQTPATSQSDILAERQFLIQMMALLENAFFALNMVNYSWNADFGWLQVVRIWRHTSIFKTHWPSFKQEFSKEFRDFLDNFNLENI